MKSQITSTFLLTTFLLLSPVTFFDSFQGPNMLVSAGPFDSMFRKCCYYVTIRNCTGSNEVAHRCADCSKPTPYCGNGRCNIFGCNCDGCLAQKENTEIIGSATWFTENF